MVIIIGYEDERVFLNGRSAYICEKTGEKLSGKKKKED